MDLRYCPMPMQFELLSQVQLAIENDGSIYGPYPAFLTMRRWDTTLEGVNSTHS
jgi:hypothetical protein